MKRVNLLLTDQPSSGSKMATTGHSTSSGSTRTKAAKGLFSHFMFLASLLLITLLTSGKALATDYDVTLEDASGKLEITKGATITDGTGDGREIKIAVKSENQATHKLPESVTIDMGGNVADFTYEDGTISLDNDLNITGNLTITAAAVCTDATLSALTYQLGSGEKVNVPSFSSDGTEYNLTDLLYTKEATVTLDGTTTDANASITEHDAVTFTNTDGVKTAQATITVTAEDGTTKTYTVDFTFAKDELATAPAPEFATFEGRTANEAAALEALRSKAGEMAITTASDEAAEALPITWTYSDENEGDYDPAGGKSHAFTWKVTFPKTLGNAAGLKNTGDIIVENVAAATENALTTLTYALLQGDPTDVTTNVERDTENKEYAVELPFGTAANATITVAATASPYASITVNETPFTASTTVTLEEGEATLVLTVTSESAAARTVTIKFTTSTKSTDATIKTLTYKIGEGEEVAIPGRNEAPNTNDVTLPFGTTKVAVFVTPNNDQATVKKTEDEGAPAGFTADAQPTRFDVNIDGETSFPFTVTAGDGSTKKFIIKFTLDVEKVTKVEVPATFTLPSKVEGDAETAKAAAIALLPNVGDEGVTVSTNGNTTMKLVWTIDEYNTADGQDNTFTWTVKTDANEDLGSINKGVQQTGTTVVTNYMPALDKGDENTEVTIDATTPYSQVGNGEDPIVVKSITVKKAMDEIVLDQVTVNDELKVEDTATGLTLVLKGSNSIKKLTNAGVLTLRQEDATQPASLLSAIPSKAAAAVNNGPIKNVDNNGKLIDETATITIVGGAAALTIETLPTAQSTTGSQATLSVVAATTTGNALTYQWQKQSSNGWVSAIGTGNKANELTVEKSGDGSGYYRCQVVNPVNGNQVTTLYTPAVNVRFYTENIPDEPSTPSTPTYTVSLDKVTGATFSKGETTTVDEGENFSFKITLDKDYDQSKPVVTVDGTAITADADGNYTIKNIQKDIKIIVSGIVKNTATGIEDAVVDATRAWSVGSTLYIHVPEAADIYVVSGTGALQQQLRGVSGDYNMQLRAGFYIVRIGNYTAKVIIR